MPLRGEVWDINLEPTLGHEQAKTRPCVVISNDVMNERMALSIVVPFTGTPHYAKSGRLSPSMVAVIPPNGGLSKTSYSMAYQVRTVSHKRFQQKRGTLDLNALRAIVRSVQAIIDS